MRTSRVYPTTSSTFQNRRPVIQTNDSLYQPGEQHQHKEQQHESFKEVVETNLKPEENVKKQFTEHNLELINTIQNVNSDKDLNVTVKKLCEVNNKKKRLQSYRSSI